MSVSEEYDAIVIGAGHNGLGLGAYLARSGMKVAVLEGHSKLGGGCSTEEVTLPGFKSDLHAVTLGSYPPIYRDFDLQKFGLKFVAPPVHAALLLSDGSSMVLYRNDPKRNFKVLTRFSQRDANTVQQIFKKYHKVRFKEYYSPPKPHWERGEGLSAEERREYQRMVSLTPRQLACEMYESEEVRTFFCLRAMELGAVDFYDGTGDVIIRLAADPGYFLVGGGTVELAYAIVRLIEHYGGKVLTNAKVSRILLRDGEARGVELADGRGISAKKLVASSVDPGQTFLKFVGEENLEPSFVGKVKGLKPPAVSPFTPHLALKEPPNYSIAGDRDVNQAVILFIGFDSLRDLDAHWREIGEGRPPSTPGGIVLCPSMHDPSRVPSYGHVALMWQYCPIAGACREYAKDDYMERCIERWREYATNLTDGNILGKYAYSPADMVARDPAMVGGGGIHVAYGHGQYYYRRPLQECSRYRTMIKGLYLCGSSCHPGGNVRFGPAYNAFQVIAEDLKIDRWWAPLSTEGTPLAAE